MAREHPRYRDGSCSAQELADVLGLGPVAIRILVRDGVIERHRWGEYPMLKCVGQYVRYLRDRAQGQDGSRGGSLTKQRERHTRLRADAEEIKLKQITGEVVPVNEMIAAATAEATRVRTRILAVGPKLAPRLVGLKRATDAQEIVTAELEECLEGLADLEEAPDRIAARQSGTISRRLPKSAPPASEADDI